MTDIVIALDAVPNQDFTFDNVSGHWQIDIKTANTSMLCDLRLNGEILLLGSRIVAGRPIIPYGHLAANGNFAILTDADEQPWWERFGMNGQVLIYWNDADD